MPSAHTRHVFHARVPLAKGTDRLIPASALADVNPEAHAAAMAKYDDAPERRRLRDTVIPILDLAWTDVVFLSPVHPHAIWRTWLELTERELPPVEFWAIPVDELPGRAVLFDRTMSAVGEPIDPSEVTPLDRQAFRTATQTTPGNREWLQSVAARGQSGAWFNRLPHVLAAGAVPLTRAEVIDWSAPF